MLTLLEPNMLPPVVTKTVENLTSAITSFVVVTVVGVLVALVLANLFGRKSQANRQAIFSIVSFGSLCFGAYYAISKFRGT